MTRAVCDAGVSGTTRLRSGCVESTSGVRVWDDPATLMGSGADQAEL